MDSEFLSISWGVAALFVETLLYGILVMLYIVTLYVLFRWSSFDHLGIKLILSMTSTFMFLLATVHIALHVSHPFQRYSPGSTGNPIQIAEAAIYITQTLAGDFFLIYRCWMVCNRRLVVVLFPSVCSLAAAVTGYYSLVSSWLFLALLFCLSLLSNVVCTSLIAKKLVKHHRQTFWVTGDSQKHVIALMVEAGVTYNTVLFVTYLTFVIPSPASRPSAGSVSAVLIYALTPLIAIIFNVIIIQVALRRGPKGNSDVVLEETVTYGGIQRSPLTPVTPDAPPLDISQTSLISHSGVRDSSTLYNSTLSILPQSGSSIQEPRPLENV